MVFFGLALAVIANLTWLLCIVQNRQKAVPAGQVELSTDELAADVPVQRGRIDTYIATIRDETLEQSIARMSLHEPLLVRSGLDAEQMLPWPHATERCLANRRLARVQEALADLPEEERARRAAGLFDNAFTEFTSVVDKGLARWEQGNPPTDTTELLGPGRSLDGYFWALSGAQLLGAQFCPPGKVLEQYERIEQYERATAARVQRTPEVLGPPFQEVAYLLGPDLFQLNLARLVFHRLGKLTTLDALMPVSMVPEESRFYAWDAPTNEQDFTHQRRGVPKDERRVLRTFSFYRRWQEDLRVRKGARQDLIDRCWATLRQDVESADQ